MNTARKFHSDFFNTDCLHLGTGEVVFSLTEAAHLITGQAGGENLKAIKSAAEKTSGPQPSVIARVFGQKGPIFPVLVDNGHMRQEALAMNQDTFIEVLKVYAEKKTKGGENARKLLHTLIGVSLKLILEKEAGLLSEQTTRDVDAAIAHFFKPIPSLERADSIRELKQLLKANGQKDRSARMGILINELVYNRLPKEVYDSLDQQSNIYKGGSGHTKWQHLSPATQQRIDDIIVVARMLIEKEMETGQILNFAPVILDLDKVMPRHRSSGYVSL